MPIHTPTLIRVHVLVLLCIAGWAAATVAEETTPPIGRISFYVGDVRLRGKDATTWDAVKLEQPLRQSDVLRTGGESRAELLFQDGSLVRMGEQSMLDLEEFQIEENRIQGKLQILFGRIWSNLRKVGQRSFEVQSPTAVMAVRGTTFRADAHRDSTFQMWVYEGKVDVNRRISVTPEARSEPGVKPQTESEPGREKVPGPQPVPGPYEVTLKEWLQVVGRMTFILQRDGIYRLKEFDPGSDALDPWVKWNHERDELIW